VRRKCWPLVGGAWRSPVRGSLESIRPAHDCETQCSYFVHARSQPSDCRWRMLHKAEQSLLTLVAPESQGCSHSASTMNTLDLSGECKPGNDGLCSLGQLN
jgi:hypothetical protein